MFVESPFMRNNKFIFVGDLLLENKYLNNMCIFVGDLLLGSKYLTEGRNIT